MKTNASGTSGQSHASGASFTDDGQQRYESIHAERSQNSRRVKRWGFMDAWKAHHKYSLSEALNLLRVMPLQMLFNALVTGIALALPAALFSIIAPLQSLNHHWQSQAELSLFMTPNLAPALLEEVKQQLEQHPDIQSVRIITPEEGLASIGASAGAQDVVAFLKRNPLPPVISVIPQNGLQAGALEALKARLQTMPHVEEALLDLEWVQKLESVFTLGQTLFWGLAVMLGAAIMLVIGNALRLMIEHQRETVQVLKLCGATDTYIRRPFLYAGALLGALGGAFAVLLLAIAAIRIAPELTAFETAFALEVHWRLLTFTEAVMLILDGVVLGLFGTWLALSRYLRRFDLELSKTL